MAGREGRPRKSATAKGLEGLVCWCKGGACLSCWWHRQEGNRTETGQESSRVPQGGKERGTQLAPACAVGGKVGREEGTSVAGAFSREAEGRQKREGRAGDMPPAAEQGRGKAEPPAQF
jgi:hypothetical protein